MKRKKILMIEPVPTRKKGTVITAQTQEKLLVLNIYRERELSCRYVMNTGTGEYEVWDAKTGEWRQEKAYVAAGGSYWSGPYGMEVRYDPPEAEQEILEAVKPLLAWKKERALVALDTVESMYARERREKKEERRIIRLEEMMARVPPIPEGFRDWILQKVGKDFVFWDGKEKAYRCTACGKRHTKKEIPGTNRETVQCPETGRAVQIRTRKKQEQEWARACLMQSMDETQAVCRHFDARIDWDGDGVHLHLSEAVRIMILRDRKKEPCKIYYNQFTRDRKGCYFDKRNPANRRMGLEFLWPEGIREALEGTAYQRETGIFTCMAGAGQRADYNMLMWYGTPGRGAMEYLVKGRFSRLVEEISQRCWSGEYNRLLSGTDAREVLGIRDRQKINRIREENGGWLMVEWMQWSEKTGKKISREAMGWLDRQNLYPEDLEGIQMSVESFMNFIRRQQAESYPTFRETSVIQQYKDYLSMAERMGKDLDDEMVYRPRELKRRHDELAEEIRRQQQIETMKRNREAAEEREKQLREQFPGAEENLAEVREIYSYEGKDFVVIVPKQLSEIILEGQALHHCAGATDRYFERIAQRETYIFFLRRAQDPETPYYTLEVEPGGTIRQSRTMYDEETGIEEVRGFLRGWQKEIKKRLTAAEREAAKVSAVKREENLEELRRKNNTRVLKALMEDFMEAV